MKRLFVVLLALSLLLSLSACGLLESKPAPSTAPSVSIEDTAEPSSSESESTDESSTEESTEESTEPPEPYALENSFVQTYRTQSGAVWAMAVAEIKNIGDTAVYLDYADFALLDEGGQTIGPMDTVSSYPQVIAPGETGYYCDVISLDVPQELELTLSFEAEIVPVDYDPIRYNTHDAVLSNSPYGGVELSAFVENTAEEDGDFVCIAAILKDQNGRFLGFISGYLNDILPVGKSQEINFEGFMLPTDLTSEAVAEVEVFAYPLLEQP